MGLSSPADVARSYLGAFATGDAESIAAHVTDDFRNEHTAVLGAPSDGKAEYLERLPTFLATFPGVRYDVEDVIAEGTKVAAAYTMRATYEGTPFEIRGLMRFFVRDGLIERRVDYWDGLSFLRQTGQA